MKDYFFLARGASKARLREAENARENRAEIIKAFSQGKVSRRDLMKWGLIASAGILAPVSGLSPFAPSVYADGGSSIPTGAPPSPLFGVQAFTQPMPRFDVLPRDPVSSLNPAPQAESNQTQQPVPESLGGGMGPIEGRPPGPVWAHQQFDLLPPQVAISATMEGAKVNTVYNPGVTSDFNSGIDASAPFPPRFHPDLPDQGPLAFWTYQGTFPPKLMQVRYGGDAVLFRLSNKLPPDFSRTAALAASPPPRTSTTGTMARRMTALPEPISSPVSFTIITTRSFSRDGIPSTPTPPILAQAVRMMRAGSTRSPATGMKPCPPTGSTITCSVSPRRTCTRAWLECSTFTAPSIAGMRD